MTGILEKLADLHKQATTERSHYYVASVVREAITEIESLRRGKDAARAAGYAAGVEASAEIASEMTGHAVAAIIRALLKKETTP